MAVGDLPPNVAAHVLGRVNEAWEDFLERARADCLAVPRNLDRPAIAPSHEEADVNEGVSSSGGQGMHFRPDGIYVRMDGGENDDLGPYADAAEALRATLPQHYSLSGPEFHSTADIARLVPSPEVAEAVKALEAKADEAWKAANPASSFR